MWIEKENGKSINSERNVVEAGIQGPDPSGPGFHLHPHMHLCIDLSNWVAYIPIKFAKEDFAPQFPKTFGGADQLEQTLCYRGTTTSAQKWKVIITLKGRPQAGCTPNKLAWGRLLSCNLQDPPVPPFPPAPGHSRHLQRAGADNMHMTSSAACHRSVS